MSSLKTIRKQLQRFHSNLSPRKRSLMVRHDLNNVRRNCHGSLPLPHHEIVAAFLWEPSPEGHKYWAARQGWRTE